MADNLPAQPVATGLISAEQQRAIAEVQARMIIARAQPRDTHRALELILQDCRHLPLAEEGLYEYTRGGNEIRGASIKLMQAIASRWQNLQSGIKILDRRDGYTECAAFAWDLENNFYDERQFRVSHTRTTRRGSYRITDDRDLYEAEANAGQRRKRAALEAVIPSDIVKAAERQCDDTLLSNADTSPEGLQKLVTAFAAFGVTLQQIEIRIQRRLDTIRPRQIVQLKRIWSSLNDQMSDPADWFQMQPQQQQSTVPPSTGTEALRARLAPKAPARPAESDLASDVSEQAGGEDVASAGSAEVSDTVPVDPPSPPDSPRDQPVQEPGHPEGIIKPIRLRRGGWDWERYGDEYLAAATALPREQLTAWRARQAQMYSVFHDSALDIWERVEDALAAHVWNE